MSVTHQYTCARVKEQPRHPREYGLSGYSAKTCENCPEFIWVGPWAEEFKKKHPDGQVVCMDCAMKSLEGKESPGVIVVKASEAL